MPDFWTKFRLVTLPTDLLNHLRDRLGLDSRQAERVVEEIISYYDESVETFVRRRHAELQRQGLRNVEIFAHLQDELNSRRFPAPHATERQLRRWVYG